jgi:hypothetical protein
VHALTLLFPCVDPSTHSHVPSRRWLASALQQPPQLPSDLRGRPVARRTAKMGEHKAAQRTRIETSGQVVSDQLFYVKQVREEGSCSHRALELSNHLIGQSVGARIRETWRSACGAVCAVQHDELGNACGTVAAIHTLANSGVPLSGPVGAFVAANRGRSAADVGWALAQDAPQLKEASESSAEGGQTETPNREDQVPLSLSLSLSVCCMRMGGQR